MCTLFGMEKVPAMNATFLRGCWMLTSHHFVGLAIPGAMPLAYALWAYRAILA